MSPNWHELVEGYTHIPRPIPNEPGCCVREIPHASIVSATGHIYSAFACAYWVQGKAYVTYATLQKFPSLIWLMNEMRHFPHHFYPVSPA
jgi:hypothetical protein